MKLINKIIKNFLSFVLPNDIIMWHANRKKVGNDIAITFDDGPNSVYTEKVISILQKYNIKATFFLLGCEVEKHPEIVIDLVRFGHSIGNHTYSHRYNLKTDMNDLKTEIQRTQAIIEHTTGIIPTLFRPPHGYISTKMLEHCIKKRLSIILWSIDSTDYKKVNTESIINTVNKNTIKPGEIILFHDDNEYTLEALPIIIENLKKKYKFVTIEQMIRAK